MKLIVSAWKVKEGSQLEADGLIRRNTNKPEYGSLMLTSAVVSINKGYMNKKTKIGFVTAKVDELSDLIHDKGLVAGSDFSEMVAPHRIVVIEKTADEMTDNDRGFVQKVNPSTGEVLSKNGEIIYRKTEVVEEGSDIHDILLTHDTVPIIDEANKDFDKSKKPEVIAQL